MADLTFQSFDQTGTNKLMKAVREVQFVTGTKDGQWWFRSTDASQDAIYSYVEVGTDGVATYSLKLSRRAVSGADGSLRERKSISGVPIAPFTATIAEGLVPIEDGYSQVAPLWLAVASAPMLVKRPESIPPVWFIPSQWYSPGLSYPVRIVELLQGSHLPKEVIFYSRGSEIVNPRSGTGSTIQRYAAPYDQGFKTAHFTTTRMLAQGSLVFPRGFELLLYAPVQGGKSSNDLVRIAQWNGSIRQIALTSSRRDDYRPEVVDLTFVVDLRTPPNTRLPSFSYVISNAWPEAQSPTIAAIKAKQLHSAERGAFRNASSPATSRSILAIVAIVAILVLGSVAITLVSTRTNKKGDCQL